MMGGLWGDFGVCEACRPYLGMEGKFGCTDQARNTGQEC
jgi:hypothetical protein